MSIFRTFPAGICTVEIDDITEFYNWTRDEVTMVTLSNQSDSGELYSRISCISLDVV